MAGKSKSDLAAELIRRRIANGCYANRALPGAPKLAQELGISYMTIRQTMQQLIDSGDVVRASNGRLVLPAAPEAGDGPPLKVLFLHSSELGPRDKWRRAIMENVLRFGCSYCDVIYTNSDDPVVYETLDAEFDLLFFQLSAPNPLLLKKMIRNRQRIVSLFHDLTPHKIRCLDGINIDVIGLLLAGLVRRGCRKIDFLNSEELPEKLPLRQLAWKRAIEKLHCAGDAYDERPVYPDGSIECAMALTQRLIREGKLAGTDALFCNSVSTARGVLRALADHGIKVPQDLAVVSFGTPELAKICIPSLSVINTPPLVPLVRQVFEHYLGLHPDPARLFYRIELKDVPKGMMFQWGESVAAKYHDQQENP